ncbi:hypothetical protein, partial [Burkholderia pyrrocinia]|uniref:hypothetical protein n=1 Tax=Burkholderia pyrrocinia TaxID=60550 RepID=UPI001ABB0AC0
IDGITLLCVLHRSVCRMNGLARNNNGDNTPRIMTATGGENHAGPGWPKPRLSGREDSNGGDGLT